MQLISSVWRIGLPVAVVAFCALMVVMAVRSTEKPASRSRAFAVLAILVWLRLAGEAALGDHRPVLERQWKGAAAALLAVAAIIHLWRRRHWRDLAPSASVSAAQDQPVPTAPATITMPHDVTMPALGRDVTEATVTRWLKQTGDRVEAGEPLVHLSTDKIDIEIPADVSGHLYEITIPAGTTAPTGSTIAVISRLAGSAT